MSDDPISVRHELLLKEAEWMREDAEHLRQYIDRLLVGYLVTFSLLAGWIVNKAFATRVDASYVDGAVWAARLRPEIALPLCAVAALTPFYMLLNLAYRARWADCHTRLDEIIRKLGMSPPAPSLMRAYFGNIAALVTTAIPFAMTGFSLWFARPAARQSIVIGIAWWIAVSMVAATILMFVGLRGVLRRARAGETPRRRR